MQSLKPLVIAHRGFSSIAPENTIAAVKEALKLGVDMIEVDVHQSKDGHVVLIHDSTLLRTSGKIKKVRNSSLNELQKLDVGSWFDDKFSGEKIPLLDEVLELVKNKCKLLIEIKQGSRFYKDIEKNIIELINKHDGKKWCIIQSFKDEVLGNITHIDSTIEIHKLVRGNVGMLPLHIDFFIKPGRINKYNKVSAVNIFHKRLNPQLIQELQQREQKVYAYTVNEVADMKKAIALGVDGIITNYPDRLKKLLKE